jgi:hypothetical protein
MVRISLKAISFFYFHFTYALGQKNIIQTQEENHQGSRA